MAETVRKNSTGLATTGTSERIVKPENCALAIAIPTSIEAFRSQRTSISEGDQDESFVKMFVSEWRYVHEVVAPFQSLKPDIDRLRVQLHTDLTLQEFENLFHSEAADVVILFAHWDTHHVEFFDGPAGVASVAEKVPRAYSGILDLCVCDQKELATTLRQGRRDCVIGFTNRGATPYRWLYFYTVVFKYLREYDLTYLEAFEKAFNAIFLREGAAKGHEKTETTG